MHQYSQTHSARGETLGAVTASSESTTVTANAGASNTYGNWQAIGTAGFTYEYCIASLTRCSIAQDYLVDIGIDDGAGNVWVLAEKLHHQSRSGGAADNVASIYPLPLHVPVGAQLVARCMCSSAGGTIGVTLHGYSTNPQGAPGFSRCVPLFTAANSRGPAVDAGGVSHTKGTTIQLVASSSVQVAAVFASIGPNADVARTTANARALLDLGIGASGQEFWFLANYPLIWTTATDTPWPNTTPIIPVGAPVSSRFATRMQSNITAAGDRTCDVCLYGLVP